ncbi:hypothetical protein [Halostreptopolyspora alba]|uniref:Uncharacterized protein n=1 Tax=Halostreptopolyspora alba TaxID=2487137 RepID=A0A3N0E9M0_9ACTN|nr:hypothetical protein EFW17_11465 [Nocardiopsaceae bacterium YIM 96095]
MYGLIWRVLPGPWFVKLMLSFGLVAGAAALLWYVAFPEIAPHMPFRDSAVEVDEPRNGGDAGQPQQDADDAGGGENGDGGGTETSEGSGENGNEAPSDEEGIVGVDVPVGDNDS